MCDGLARNLPEELDTILSNCLAHGRRKFVELYDRFPEECRHVIEAFKVIYHNDKVAREEKMSAEARLVHLAPDPQPGRPWTTFITWLQRQFDEIDWSNRTRRWGTRSTICSNAGNGSRCSCGQAGAPLDNNICERALKKTILHRKNSMFYKTRQGARGGDMHMSLIHTCELSGANALDYLDRLQLNAADVSQQSPERWMPWNYRDSVTATSDAA